MTRSQPSLLVRFHRLERKRRALLVEAAWTLGLAAAAVRLLPFRRAIRLGSVARDKEAAPAADCVWAVEAAARRLPWRNVCIQQGIALQRMLSRRGIDADLHYGARHSPEDGALQAHVWVTAGGETLIGGREAGGFAEIAVYPGAGR